MLLIVLVAILAFFVIPMPQAQAMEPVTIALLAPVALEVAKVAAPYVIAGLKNLGVGMIEMGIEMLNFFRLPLGLFEISFGAPFGLFGDGVIDIVKGSIAPFKMMLHAITLPIRPFGAIF